MEKIDLIGPDQRFSSPEATWELYTTALTASNLEAALECHVSGNGHYRNIFTAIGRQEMKEIGKDMKPIEKIIMDRHRTKYRIKRMEQGQEITYYIYFLNTHGEWKIEQY